MLSTPRAEVSLARGQKEPLQCVSQERALDEYGDLLFSDIKKSIAVQGFPVHPLFSTLLKETVAVLNKVIESS